MTELRYILNMTLLKVFFNEIFLLLSAFGNELFTYTRCFGKFEYLEHIRVFSKHHILKYSLAKIYFKTDILNVRLNKTF